MLLSARAALWIVCPFLPISIGNLRIWTIGVRTSPVRPVNILGLGFVGAIRELLVVLEIHSTPITDAMLFGPRAANRVDIPTTVGIFGGWVWALEVGAFPVRPILVLGNRPVGFIGKLIFVLEI